MNAVLYLKHILVTGNKDHKKMNCKLYGTEIMETNKASDDLEEGRRLTQREGAKISEKQFPIPDKIMILIYERDKEYVDTF